MIQPTGFRELSLPELDRILGGNTDAPAFPMDGWGWDNTTSPDTGPFTDNASGIV